MSLEIKAPTFPESINEGSIAAWHRQPGQAVRRDELLVEIETDKVVLEVVAAEDGVLTSIIKGEGETVLSDEVIGQFSVEAVPVVPDQKANKAKATDDKAAAAAPTPKSEAKAIPRVGAGTPSGANAAGPAARKLAEEKGVSLTRVQGSGKDGRVTKSDVLQAASAAPKARADSSDQRGASAAPSKALTGLAALTPLVDDGARAERRVPMTRLRASIAKRLVEAQRTAAMLTTFNEVDMTGVMAVRERYKAQFEKSHDGVRLGFMSFFVRASVEALKRFPAVNASIDGDDVVYHGYYDVGVAVSAERGLVVPVLRDADAMSMAQIEQQIREYGIKARDNKLSLNDISGGTFTISNGGVFGSLMSTPILNPPQTGILGMHKIEERAVVQDGAIVIRPMMYLALSYDHRLIDGQEAVRFLVAIKELIEDPVRILLDI